jgi:hypothetical protein
LLGSQAHRPVPGKLLPRSIQFGIALAPRLPHRVHRMCRVNDGTGTSFGQASTLTSVLLPQVRQVAKSERTPRLRMLPSVIGLVGSSDRGIGGHSIPDRDRPEPAWNGGYAPHHRFVEASGTAPGRQVGKPGPQSMVDCTICITPLRVRVKRLPPDSAFDRHFPKRSPRTKGHHARGRSTQLELITEQTWPMIGADGAPIGRHRQ